MFSRFWVDLSEDFKDPVFKREFIKSAKRIRRRDRIINFLRRRSTGVPLDQMRATCADDACTKSYVDGSRTDHSGRGDG